jgi:hypothetical protein
MAFLENFNFGDWENKFITNVFNFWKILSFKKKNFV